MSDIVSRWNVFKECGQYWLGFLPCNTAWVSNCYLCTNINHLHTTEICFTFSGSQCVWDWCFHWLNCQTVTDLITPASFWLLFAPLLHPRFKLAVLDCIDDGLENVKIVE